MTAAETSPVIRRQLYPAKATLPDGSALRLVKLVVTAERVYLFTLVDGQVQCAFDQPYTDAVLPPAYAPRSDAYQLTTPGGVLQVWRIPGCGCHAQPLKQYRPFPHTAARLAPTT